MVLRNLSQYAAEKRLAIAYSICAALGLISSVTTGIAWGHWKTTLDRCRIGTNCSCILFGRHSYSYFYGGDAAPCVWVTFGPILYILFCGAMICFHGYRVLFSFETSVNRTIVSRNAAGETVQMHVVQPQDTSPLPRSFWITMTTFTSIFIIYSFSHFVVFIVGFYKTCGEYRQTLERTLGVTGNSNLVLHNRLSCQAVFDFMDYLLSPSGNLQVDGIINTGLDLILGITASYLSFLAFIYCSVINFKMTRIS